MTIVFMDVKDSQVETKNYFEFNGIIYKEAYLLQYKQHSVLTVRAV